MWPTPDRMSVCMRGQCLTTSLGGNPLVWRRVVRSFEVQSVRCVCSLCVCGKTELLQVVVVVQQTPSVCLMSINPGSTVGDVCGGSTGTSLSGLLMLESQYRKQFAPWVLKDSCAHNQFIFHKCSKAGCN